MENLGYRFLSFFCGVLLGGLNWCLMYRLYGRMLSLATQDNTTGREKAKLGIGYLFKIVLLFGGCYLFLAILKMSALWFTIGILLSLAVTVFVLYKRSR